LGRLGQQRVVRWTGPGKEKLGLRLAGLEKKKRISGLQFGGLRLGY
jgi:hypothetical protein